MSDTNTNQIEILAYMIADVYVEEYKEQTEEGLLKKKKKEEKKEEALKAKAAGKK